MGKTITGLLAIFYLSTFLSFAQQTNIKIDCESAPLNELLIQWRKSYNFQFSFNDAALSKYKISLHQNFESIEQALETILKDLPFAFEKQSSVYIIYPEEKPIASKTYYLIGKLIDAKTSEPLPFSHIIANDQHTVTDIKGSFGFTFKDDSLYSVKASHLGYYIMDTTLTAGSNYQLKLTPSFVGIKEIVVTNNIVEKSTQLGESPGLTSLNHQIANYLPGNGDNSVFNLLRLQPGILAAGEQPNDLIIWGSPEGTSRVIYDGFTIWGLKNFSDNISAVNPYLAKNIEVLKGGYNVGHEDMVGGLVKISGKNGSTVKPGVNLFLNNQTLNGMIELPLSEKTSLLAAFRQTYYNLFDSDDLKAVRRANEQSNEPIIAEPDYDFRDFNLKYSVQGDNGDLFYISLLHGEDDFEMQASREYTHRTWQVNIKEDNQQNGGTLYWGKTWEKGHSSDIKLSYSSLRSNYYNKRDVSFNKTNYIKVNHDEKAQNEVVESTLDINHNLLLNKSNKLTFGAGLTRNIVTLTEDTSSYRYIELEENTTRLHAYLKNRFQPKPSISLTTGLRFNQVPNTGKVFWAPRLDLTFKPREHLKFNIAWGLYQQFLVKTSVLEDDNYRYSWSLADDKDIPVMKSEHWVAGFAYTPGKFIFSIDAFHKENKGLLRYAKHKSNPSVFNGQSRSYGLDVYFKKDFNKHSLWAAYTLSRTDERFSNYRDYDYRRALLDQRHELKLAGLLNLGAFHLSSSYVYGSGFPLYSNYYKKEYTEPNYNRLDGSLIYRINSEKFMSEVGISVLNITDANNIKYSQFERIPLEQINTAYVNTESIPLTFLLYLKIHL